MPTYTRAAIIRAEEEVREALAFLRRCEVPPPYPPEFVDLIREAIRHGKDAARQVRAEEAQLSERQRWEWLEL